MQINKGQFSLDAKRKFLDFQWKRGRGNFLRYLWNRFRWHYYPRLHQGGQFPDHVDLELSSACDMKCPMCYTITDQYKRDVKLGLMKTDLFKRLVDECAGHGCYSIRLSLRGEPFLHKQIVELVRYAKQKGIREVSTLTNGLKLNPNLFIELMEAGLDWITISFDGMGETYNRIRAPANFEDAVAKIRTYHEIKKGRKAVKPIIKVQTVWPAIAANPDAFYSLFEPITDGVSANPLIDYLRKDTEIEYLENFTCPVLWQRLVVGSDGRVLLCSNDEMGAYIIGDANQESLYEIWHGERLRRARKIHLAKRGHRDIEPCKHCYYPRKTAPAKASVGARLVQIQNYTYRAQEVGK